MIAKVFTFVVSIIVKCSEIIYKNCLNENSFVLLDSIFIYSMLEYDICKCHEKSNIPFSYMLCLFCKKAYRGTKPEESFG